MSDLPRITRPSDLLAALHDRWNARDAAGFADLFVPDGVSVGFDGSTVVGAAAIAAHLGSIFADHQPATYVGRVDDERAFEPGVALVRGVAGMVPPGGDDLNPNVNTIQTVVATESDGRWRVVLLQNTPAAFHGRPEDVERLTAELRDLLPS
jgi:uncharacterized protein (TIGR02246 family)